MGDEWEKEEGFVMTVEKKSCFRGRASYSIFIKDYNDITFDF